MFYICKNCKKIDLWTCDFMRIVDSPTNLKGLQDGNEAMPGC
jgi:hypothetical protein